MGIVKHAGMSLMAALALVFSGVPDVRAEVSQAVLDAVASGNVAQINAALATASPADAKTIADALVVAANPTVIAAVAVAAANSGTQSSAALAMSAAIAAAPTALVQSVFTAVATTPGASASTVAAIALAVTLDNPSSTALAAAVKNGAALGGVTIAVTATVNQGVTTVTVQVVLPNPNQVATQQGTTA